MLHSEPNPISPLFPALSCSKSFGVEPDTTDPSCLKFRICAFGYSLGTRSCSPNEVFDGSLLKCVTGEGCNQLQSQVKTSPQPTRYQPDFQKSTACPHSNYIVCSYPAWGIEGFGPDKVDFSMCTHVIYVFATISDDFIISSEGIPSPNIPGQESIRAKYPDLSFLISVGGWEASQSGKHLFKTLFASAENSQTFADSVVQYLEKYSFDGLDMAFLHPDPSDKDNYAQFMAILKNALSKNNHILTASISGTIGQLTHQFDFNALQSSVDHYHVMAYEYHGFWNEQADHHSPLFKRFWDKSGLDVESVVHFLQETGVPPEKIVLQIPAFGRSFITKGLKKEPPIPSDKDKSLANKDKYVSYSKICENILTSNSNWTFVDQASAPYAFLDQFWVGFDSPFSVRNKAMYILRKRLRGALLFHLGDEDFNDVCGPSYQLLTSINSVFRAPPCQSYEDRKPTVKPTHCNKDKKIICYYTSWSKWRTGLGKFDTSNFDPSICTHVVYAFLDISKEFVLSADEESMEMRKLQEAHPQIKFLASIGGSGNSQNHKSFYQSLITDPSHRLKFANSAVNFLQHFHWNGLDLDYIGLLPSEKDGYCKLVKVLKSKLSQADLELTVTVTGTKEHMRESYDLLCLSDNTDAVVALTYGYHDTSSNTTGHFAPFHSPLDNGLDVRSIINFLVSAGVAPEKLILSLPAFGETYTTEGEAKDPPQITTGPGLKGQFTNALGVLSYTELCLNFKDGGWTKGGSAETGIYMYKDNQWVSYDDRDCFQTKIQYVLEHDLGGVMIWEVSFDDFRPLCSDERNPLLKTIEKHLCTNETLEN